MTIGQTATISETARQAETIAGLNSRIAELERALGRNVPWSAPTFENGWINFDAPDLGYEDAGYRKLGDVTYLQGAVRSGDLVGEPIFTLPDGYRPERTQAFTVTSDLGVAHVEVRADGTVVALDGWTLGAGRINLDGIQFPSIAASGVTPPITTTGFRLLTDEGGSLLTDAGGFLLTDGAS